MGNGERFSETRIGDSLWQGGEAGGQDLFDRPEGARGGVCGSGQSCSAAAAHRGVSVSSVVKLM